MLKRVVVAGLSLAAGCSAFSGGLPATATTLGAARSISTTSSGRVALAARTGGLAFAGVPSLRRAAGTAASMSVLDGISAVRSLSDPQPRCHCPCRRPRQGVVRLSSKKSSDEDVLEQCFARDMMLCGQAVSRESVALALAHDRFLQ